MSKNPTSAAVPIVAKIPVPIVQQYRPHHDLPDRLRAGEALAPGEALRSPNGLYELALQLDGNLVLYMGRRALWASGTAGQPVKYVLMQDDGNFVLYGPTQAIWDTGTHYTKPKGEYIVLQDDGNLV